MVTRRFVFFKVKSPEESADFVSRHSFLRRDGKRRPAKLVLIVWHSQNPMPKSGGVTSCGWIQWVTPNGVSGTPPRIISPPFPLHFLQGKRGGRDLSSLRASRSRKICSLP